MEKLAYPDPNAKPEKKKKVWIFLRTLLKRTNTFLRSRFTILPHRAKARMPTSPPMPPNLPQNPQSLLHHPVKKPLKRP